MSLSEIKKQVALGKDGGNSEKQRKFLVLLSCFFLLLSSFNKIILREMSFWCEKFSLSLYIPEFSELTNRYVAQNLKNKSANVWKETLWRNFLLKNQKQNFELLLRFEIRLDFKIISGPIFKAQPQNTHN